MSRSNTPARPKSGYDKGDPPAYHHVMLKDEVNGMLEIIKRDRAMETKSHSKRVILAVLSKDAAVESLTNSLQPSGFESLKFWSSPKKLGIDCLVKVTTKKNLQKTIDNIEANKKLSNIFMIVSSNVHEISFDVSSEKITDLEILRCSLHGASPGQKDLKIDGASTFCGTRLDQWQVNSQRRLYLGQEGIQIRVKDPTAIPGWGNTTQGASTNVGSDEVKKVMAELGTTDNASSHTWSEWWDKWKGPAAAVVGVATATTKFAFSLSGAAGGVAVKYTASVPFATYTFESVAIGAKFSALITSAGPAVLLGAATATAVYFVPWKKFFGWLGDALKTIFNAISSLLEWFKGWWERFTNWRENTFNASRIQQHVPKSKTHHHGRRRHRKRD